MDMSAVAGPNLQQTSARKSPSRAGADFAGAFAAARSAETTRPSIRSPLLAAKLILPTRQNVQQLASGLGLKLATRFEAAGLPKTPAVTFTVDAAGGIHASGERADLAAIGSAVASDESLQRWIRATDAIAAHAHDMENGGQLQVQRAYRLSSDTQEIVAQYANLATGQRRGSTSLGFCAGVVSVVADGATWTSG